MSRSIEELLPEKQPAKLRIYAWSTTELPKFKECLKVGQTTQADVNVRIVQSQGVNRVKYVVQVNEFAEGDNGATFRDSTVRKRLE